MEQFVTLEKARLWTTSNGKGIPLLLCNGGPGCDDYLGPVSALIEDRCQVVRFEPRGCGRSTYDGQYGLATTIADMEAIRQAYDIDRWVVGGHSAGPDVALAYALAYPSRVLGLIGIAGGRIVNDRDWSAVYREKRDTIGEDYGGKEFIADPAVNRMGNADWKAFIKRPTLLKDLAALQIPATFINSEQDIRPNWPTRQLAQLLPRGRYVEIAGAAHCSWLTHSEELKKEICTALEIIQAG